MGLVVVLPAVAAAPSLPPEHMHLHGGAHQAGGPFAGFLAGHSGGSDADAPPSPPGLALAAAILAGLPARPDDCPAPGEASDGATELVATWAVALAEGHTAPAAPAVAAGVESAVGLADVVAEATTNAPAGGAPPVPGVVDGEGAPAADLAPSPATADAAPSLPVKAADSLPPALTLDGAPVATPPAGTGPGANHAAPSPATTQPAMAPEQLSGALPPAGEPRAIVEGVATGDADPVPADPADLPLQPVADEAQVDTGGALPPAEDATVWRGDAREAPRTQAATAPPGPDGQPRLEGGGPEPPPGPANAGNRVVRLVGDAGQQTVTAPAATVGEGPSSPPGPVVGMASAAASSAAASSQAGGVPLQQPAAQAPVANQAGTAILETIEQGGGEVRVLLDPPELGEVTIRVVAEGDRVQLVVRAERPEVAHLFRQAETDLSALLANRGLELADLFVGNGRGEGRGFDGEGPPPGTDSPAGFAGLLAGDDAGDPAVSRHNRVRAAYNPDGALDYRV